MVPTKYPGAAVVEGEQLEAELHLEADQMVLTVPPNAELVRWPLADVRIETVGKGNYGLRCRDEQFEFIPVFDDGLDDEISLRQKFHRSVPRVDLGEPGKPGTTGTIAERVKAAGRHTKTPRSPFLLERRYRPVVLALAAVLTLVLTIGLLTVLIDTSEAETPTEEREAIPPTVAGVTVTTMAEPPSTVSDPPTTVVPATTTPPTVAPSTTVAPTSLPPTTPPTTVPAPGSIFDVGPDVLMERWNGIAAQHSESLIATNQDVGDDSFSFNAGEFVRIEGRVGGGEVERVVFLGDPSGTVADDREVLTALGLTLALVEPALPPEGRRELLAGLGLDVENPDLGGLDDEMVYRDHRYRLRWDGEIERLVFSVEPA